MTIIDTTFLQRYVDTLEKSLELLNKSDPKTIEYDMYRSASFKEFEIILEQSGKLLKKWLKPYWSGYTKPDTQYKKKVCLKIE